MTNTMLNPHFSGPGNVKPEPQFRTANKTAGVPEIVYITSYPPRQCGIATYAQDMIRAMDKKFGESFRITICPLESDQERHVYMDEVKYVLNTDRPDSFDALAAIINADSNIRLVMVQHEFGLFEKAENIFKQFLYQLRKPVVMTWHTVLPQPDAVWKTKVQHMADASAYIIVMTQASAKILMEDYWIKAAKIIVIPHGTHLVAHADKDTLKSNYELTGKTILSTFGLLSAGKCIETTLDALPIIVGKYPNILFLIIGKTHPSVIKSEGEAYREFLKSRVRELGLQRHVRFINQFLPLPILLDYLQLTDIYLFTSNDPNQAVSGTFSYAMSAGCPVISTPIPHAREVLKNDAGIIFDFEDDGQLTKALDKLLGDEVLRKNISANGLHRMAPTAWENVAVLYAVVFEKIIESEHPLSYTLPPIKLDHLQALTTDFGIIQFCRINKPDIDSGYTLDDNARALIAMGQHFAMTRNISDLSSIRIYFDFIRFCLQPEGHFLNYVNAEHEFTGQNRTNNLDDAHGRAIWALGYILSIGDIFPERFISEVEALFECTLANVTKIHSTRAMAFAIKGLYYRHTHRESTSNTHLIRTLADRLVQMYRHEAEPSWPWFESYLTYANSVLPEAVLCAWLATGDTTYREIARRSFDFLLSKIFDGDQIRVISNKSWSHRSDDMLPVANGGEQPIDVAYTVIALGTFCDAFTDTIYKHRMQTAFTWFLGNNHMRQIIYNPCTGGCYDGLEDQYVNLNQGAESTVSYLMARLTMDRIYREATLPQRSEQKLRESVAHYRWSLEPLNMEVAHV